MNGSHVLAIDQGTTGTKTVVVAGDGHVTGSASTEFTQHFPRPGWVEHDPEEIWRSVLATAEEALGRARVRPAALAALGLTTQRETVGVWGRSTCRPLPPPLVGQCPPRPGHWP